MRTLLIALSLLFFAGPAEAELIITQVDLVLSQPLQTIDLDIDQNGTVDFQLFYDVYQDSAFLHVNIPTELQEWNKVAVSGEKNKFGKDEVAGLIAGVPISNVSNFNGPINGNGPLLAQPSFAGKDILEGQGQVFVGLRFLQDVNYYYGWMLVEVDPSGQQLRVLAYAWEVQGGKEAVTRFPAGVKSTHDGEKGSLERIEHRRFRVIGKTVSVCDLLGREVMHGTEGETLDLASFPAGAYFVTGDETASKLLLR